MYTHVVFSLSHFLFKYFYQKCQQYYHSKTALERAPFWAGTPVLPAFYSHVQGYLSNSVRQAKPVYGHPEAKL